MQERQNYTQNLDLRSDLEPSKGPHLEEKTRQKDKRLGLRQRAILGGFSLATATSAVLFRGEPLEAGTTPPQDNSYDLPRAELSLIDLRSDLEAGLRSDLRALSRSDLDTTDPKIIGNLAAGANLITFISVDGNTAPVEEVVRQLENMDEKLDVVSVWSLRGGKWSNYIPGAPDIVQTLRSVDSQTPLFVRMKTAEVPNMPSIKILYMVPQDRQVNNEYVSAINTAVDDLQDWVGNQLNNGSTIRFANDAVQVVRTNHSAEWYGTHPTGEDSRWWFLNNTWSDAAALAGVRHNDLEHAWVIYIDAFVPCGQATGGGGGIAVLHGNDLRVLVNQKWIPECPTNEPVPDDGYDRAVGGLGHELLHALGLRHPPECEDENPGTPCPSDALMYQGVYQFPDARLLPDDKKRLEDSPFVGDEVRP